jgi:hypothetical protein
MGSVQQFIDEPHHAVSVSVDCDEASLDVGRVDILPTPDSTEQDLGPSRVRLAPFRSGAGRPLDL